MTALLRTLTASLIRSRFYPGYQGRPQFRDPTGGRIDRDIQWKVEMYGHAVYGNRLTVARRAVLESNLQRARDEKAGR